MMSFFIDRYVILPVLAKVESVKRDFNSRTLDNYISQHIEDSQK